MSLTNFADSAEFVAVNMLLGAFEPLLAFAMTLMINARHHFPFHSHADGGICLSKFWIAHAKSPQRGTTTPAVFDMHSRRFIRYTSRTSNK